MWQFVYYQEKNCTITIHRTITKPIKLWHAYQSYGIPIHSLMNELINSLVQCERFMAFIEFYGVIEAGCELGTYLPT